MEIYYIIINVAPYMFRPLIVAIFREEFFEGYRYITSLKMAKIGGRNM
jgi:hypothetical protein